MENQTDQKTSPLLVAISLIVNVCLAILSGYLGYQNHLVGLEKGKIENEKANLEKELLIEKNTPHLSTFYLITKTESLYAFLKKNEPFPYAQQVERFRIVENEAFEKLSLDFEMLRTKRRVTGNVHFLVVVNASDVVAHDARLMKSIGDTVPVGNIEGHSALLIPVYSGPSTNPQAAVANSYFSLSYQSKAGNIKRIFKEKIKPPVNPSWTPTLGDLRGWGRASTENDDSHLTDLLQE
jgi:hypothetical protein